MNSAGVVAVDSHCQGFEPVKGVGTAFNIQLVERVVMTLSSVGVSTVEARWATLSGVGLMATTVFMPIFIENAQGSGIGDKAVDFRQVQA